MDLRGRFAHIPSAAVARQIPAIRYRTRKDIWMMLIRGAASIGIGLILTAVPAMAGLVSPQRIQPVPDVQQVQFRGDDIAGAIIGGAIAGAVGTAIGSAVGGSCYYNDCDDDDEGYYGGGFYGGPGYYGGGYYGGGRYYRGGPGRFGGRGFHGGGPVARGGGGHPMGGHMAGGHMGGRR
jgi:hypothetical protein